MGCPDPRMPMLIVGVMSVCHAARTNRYHLNPDIFNATYHAIENASRSKEIMRPHTTTRIIGAILLFALSALAHDHSELNGVWTLVPTKSDFAGQPVVQTGTVTINDRQGIEIGRASC